MFMQLRCRIYHESENAVTCCRIKTYIQPDVTPIRPPAILAGSWPAELARPTPFRLRCKIPLSERPIEAYTATDMSIEPFNTAEAEDFPTVIQLSVFIDDRVGQLLRLTRLFEFTDIRIWGLMVVNSVDCAIVRMIVDDPDQAQTVLSQHRFPAKSTEVLVVRLPRGKRALIELWQAVLSAEINVHYTYGLLGHSHGNPTIAIYADNISMACEALLRRNFTVLGESDLRQERQ